MSQALGQVLGQVLLSGIANDLHVLTLECFSGYYLQTLKRSTEE